MCQHFATIPKVNRWIWEASLTRPAATLSPHRMRGEGGVRGVCCEIEFHRELVSVGDRWFRAFASLPPGCPTPICFPTETNAPHHEPAVERSVHAAGAFTPLGRLECPSRIRWIGPGSSLKAALQNLRHSRPSRRLPPEGGVPVHGDKAGIECSGNSHPVPIRWGEGVRRTGEGSIETSLYHIGFILTALWSYFACFPSRSSAVRR